jgi:hypothetical protein
MPGKQTANCHDPATRGGEFFREADFSLSRRSRLSAATGAHAVLRTGRQDRTHLHSGARSIADRDAAAIVA